MQSYNLIVWSYCGFIKSNCDDVNDENEGTYLHDFLPLKFYHYRPGTRTFLQVPDPSRPDVKNPYPSGPEYKVCFPAFRFPTWIRVIAKCKIGMSFSGCTCAEYFSAILQTVSNPFFSCVGQSGPCGAVRDPALPQHLFVQAIELKDTSANQNTNVNRKWATLVLHLFVSLNLGNPPNST